MPQGPISLATATPVCAGGGGLAGGAWRWRRAPPAALISRQPRRGRHRPQNGEGAAPRAYAYNYRPGPALGGGEGDTTTGAPGMNPTHIGEAVQQHETGPIRPQESRLSHVLLLSRRAGRPHRWFRGRFGGARRGLGHLTVGGFVSGGLAPSRREDRGQRIDELGVCIMVSSSVFLAPCSGSSPAGIRGLKLTLSEGSISRPLKLTLQN